MNIGEIANTAYPLKSLFFALIVLIHKWTHSGKISRNECLYSKSRKLLGIKTTL